MNKILIALLFISPSLIFENKVFSQGAKEFQKNAWFTSRDFMYCKGDLTLEKDSSSNCPVKVIFFNSDKLDIYYPQKEEMSDSIKIITDTKYYKINNEYIELDMSQHYYHGLIHYCYYKILYSDASIKLTFAEKKDFYSKKRKPEQ